MPLVADHFNQNSCHEEAFLVVHGLTNYEFTPKSRLCMKSLLVQCARTKFRLSTGKAFALVICSSLGECECVSIRNSWFPLPLSESKPKVARKCTFNLRARLSVICFRFLQPFSMALRFPFLVSVLFEFPLCYIFPYLPS